MSGSPISPITRQRRGYWLASRARYWEISVIRSPSAKAPRRCVFMSEQGYRVYYTRTGSAIYVLLAGGTKATQAKDIAKAKRMARELKRAEP